MANNTSVFGFFLRPYIRFFQSQDIDYQNSEYYLPVFDLAMQRDDLYLPFRNVSNWLHDVAAQNQVEFFEYQISEQMGCSYLPDDVAKKILNAESLVDALSQLMRYLVYVQNEVSLKISVVDQQHYCIEISRNAYIDKEDILGWLEWFELWSIIHVIRHYLGRTWLPPKIELSTYNPVAPQARKDFARTNLKLGTGAINIHLHKNDLLVSILQDCPTCVMENQAVTNLKSMVENVLTPVLSDPELSIQTAAELLDFSVRSLQRKLKQQGYSFRALLNELRCKRAMVILLSSGLSVEQVSKSVGYKDAASLTRSFRKKFGVTPKYFKSLPKNVQLKPSHPI